ncbi:ribosome silencing factor [Synechococcus sp. PCC 7336]|uniref:ribosome silencing factor n=1 Tax=Synechococcus sp. PCC 7336 TaxID=195250 RepID=UPI00034C1FE8|nr:ribosome silencing factor [Synechococcus sp. PCC 7336]
MIGQSFESSNPILGTVTALGDPTLEDSQALALTAAQTADDRQGGNIVCLNVGGVSILADFFLFVSGYSTTQVRAIASAIKDTVLEQHGRLPDRIEGLQAGTWILLDYGDVIVHVQLDSEREFYDLEAFWAHAPRVELALDPQVPS